jgi:hypothetical protein
MAQQPEAAGHQGLYFPRQRGVSRARKAGLIAAAAAGLLSACTGQVPLPESALLAPQAAPRCEYRSARADATRTELQNAAGDASDTGQDVQRKLDYERECYRQAEMLTRARLRRLQMSVSRTVVALKEERAKGTELPRSTAGP